MDTLWQDIRFAFRTLRRNPAFALVTLFTLTLGIAATSSVASVVSAVLLQPPPYEHPERLVLLQLFKNENGSLETFPCSWLDFQDWRERSQSFQDVGVYSYSLAFNLLTQGDPERVNGELVSSSYFGQLRVKPALGRLFVADEDKKKGSPRIAVVGHDLWRRRFGADPSAIGKSLVVDGATYQVGGVMPPNFKGLSDEAEIWLPVTMGNEVLGDARFLDRRAVRWLFAMGRLKPGRSVQQAEQEMQSVAAQLAREYPEADGDMVVHVKTLAQVWFGDLRFSLWTLFGASIFVLLIAWTTVANLLLARAFARRPEIAMRTGLGATRGRLMRQLVTESVVLALGSALLGLLLSRWTTAALVAASTFGFKSYVHIGLSLPVVATVVLLSVACGVFFGLMPAFLGTRSGAQQALREAKGSAGPKRHRFQSALVVVEVALALFLLIGAGLMIKGFERYRGTNLGFQPQGLLTGRVDLKGKKYANTTTMTLLGKQYLDRVRAVPGVKAAAMVGPAMPTDGWFGNSFIVEDLLNKTKDGVAYFVFHHVSPGYFSLMGMPVVRGRDFATSDTPESPLAIILSQAAADKYWPNESPLGKRMKFGKRDPNAPWFTVVGVVGNLRQQDMQAMEWPGPDVYFALFQFPPLLIPRFTFEIRPDHVAPLSLAPRVEKELSAVDPLLPPYDFDTMQHRLDAFNAKGRFQILLMTIFAGLALVIAASGLYGVLFYSVSQRQRELGIRVALGAQNDDLVRLVVGRAVTLTGWGLALGLLSAFTLNHLFQSLLYGASPVDWLTFVTTSAVLLAVALAAAYVPTRQALRVEPTTALRAE